MIPRLIEGSGGHRTILEHARALEERGHECHLYVEGAASGIGNGGEEIERLYGYSFKRVFYGWNNVAPSDAVIATVWYSAGIVRDISFPCVKIYFVQDYEACFNSMGDAYLMAENSYLYGLRPITVGRWLRAELYNKFNVFAFNFDFGANLQIYRPRQDIKKELAVCFIYQPDKPRRCARIGIEALGIVKHRMPGVKIYLYGSHPREKGNIWFDHEHLGLLKLEKCAELYNRCSVGLCISSSNPSRIPFEMMATGLPVVEVYRDNTLYDFPSEAVSLSHQTPESIAENILVLLNDASKRSAMHQAAIRFMSNRPLFMETSQFCDAFEQALAGFVPEPPTAAPLYEKPPVTAGSYVGVLPPEIRRILSAPPNAKLNALPKPLRKLLRYSEQLVRRRLGYR